MLRNLQRVRDREVQREEVRQLSQSYFSPEVSSDLPEAIGDLPEATGDLPEAPNDLYEVRNVHHKAISDPYIASMISMTSLNYQVNCLRSL